MYYYFFFKGHIYIGKPSSDQQQGNEAYLKTPVVEIDLIDTTIKELFNDQETKEMSAGVALPTQNKILFSQGILNDLTRSMHLGITPSTSMMIDASMLSSCNEDTQQLINAQISQPDSLQKFVQQKEQTANNSMFDSNNHLDTPCGTTSAEQRESDGLSVQVATANSFGSSGKLLHEILIRKFITNLLYLINKQFNEVYSI